MSILIADSGSTKTDWVLLRKGSTEQHIRTAGLNPYHRKRDEIISELKKVKQYCTSKPISQISFYGSGCGTATHRDLMKKLLSECFGLRTVRVYSDLLGAARALFGDEEGISCILGTGSNACYYDGKEIRMQVPSLGFALGDEGSGSYFGKQIVQDFYYNRLPGEIFGSLKQRRNMDLQYILNRVYKKEGGSAFIASFAEVLAEFPDHIYVKKLIKAGIEDFVEKQLNCLKGAPSTKVGMVGTVAYIHRHTIGEVLAEHNYSLILTLQSPIEGLIEYHLGKNPPANSL